jgi:hypothetical protein
VKNRKLAPSTELGSNFFEFVALNSVFARSILLYVNGNFVKGRVLGH